MPDPTALPAEIFTAVLDFVAHVNAYTPPLADYSLNVDKIRYLSACCLGNRRWHLRSSPKLYQHFYYMGRSSTFSRLWLFARTLLENPDTAALVRHAAFGSCYVGYRGLSSYAIE